jgi:hypothetical protein
VRARIRSLHFRIYHGGSEGARGRGEGGEERVRLRERERASERERTDFGPVPQAEILKNQSPVCVLSEVTSKMTFTDVCIYRTQ